MTSSKKPALVLVHGYRGSPLGLKELAGYLAGFEVYVPPIPPYGGGGELADYTPSSYAKYLAEWIRRMKLDKPVLIGHSMGSIIVAAVAEKYPKLINEKVVFLAPIASKAPRVITNLAPLATLLPNKWVSWVTTKYLFVPKDKKLFAKSLELTIACGEDCDSKRGSRKAAKFSSMYSIADFKFKKRALFLAGEKDRLNSQDKVRKVAEKYQGEVKFLKNSGHILNYEKPREVAAAIIDWL